MFDLMFHGKKIRSLLEAAKPQMVTDIEKTFGIGEDIWSEGENFQLTQKNLEQMFDLANRYIFENKLNKSEPKEIVGESQDPQFRNVVASFSHGCVSGAPHKIIMVKHAEKSNFFNSFCAVIHEMIHFYDYEFGPLGKMLRDNLFVGQLDWGPEYHSTIDQALDATEFPNSDKNNGRPYIGPRLRLKKDQLPDDMPAVSAKQYQFPWFKHKTYADMFLRGAFHPGMLPSKYVLSDVSMYDVHGRFFKLLAERANYAGFDVTETFEAWRPHKLRKVWLESETPEMMNQAEAVASRIITNEHIAFVFRNSENWFVEIM